MMRTALVTGLACCAVACAHPAPPAGLPVSPPPPPVVTPSLAVSPELAQQLESGFTTEIELRIASATTADALAVGTCRIVFDLWDAVFRVKIGTANATQRGIDAAVGSCLDRDAFERVRAAAAAGDRPFSGIVVARIVERFAPRAAVHVEHDGIWCGLTTELWREPGFDPFTVAK